MFIHPQFDHVAFSLGPFSVRWYALSYLLGFFLFAVLGRWRIRNNARAILSVEQLDSFMTWGILGVILGGRLGYVLFYNAGYYLSHPLDILKLWEGGMSFHGGLIGVLLSVFLFARQQGLSVVKLADFVAPLAPLGLASGRLGNFINGELWGRVTDAGSFWAMGFPQAAQDDALLAHENPTLAAVFKHYHMLPRHPSQLYELALEGLVLFAILWLFSRKNRPAGQVSALFFLFYGLFRFIVEFARQPDDNLGLLQLGLSMGQWLSIPMIFIGFFGFFYAQRREK